MFKWQQELHAGKQNYFNYCRLFSNLHVHTTHFYSIKHPNLSSIESGVPFYNLFYPFFV